MTERNDDHLGRLQQEFDGETNRSDEDEQDNEGNELVVLQPAQPLTRDELAGMEHERRKGVENRRDCALGCGDRRSMSIQELAELNEQAGRALTVQEAHLFRRRKVLDAAVEDMLKGGK